MEHGTISILRGRGDGSFLRNSRCRGREYPLLAAADLMATAPRLVAEGDTASLCRARWAMRRDVQPPSRAPRTRHSKLGHSLRRVLDFCNPPASAVLQAQMATHFSCRTVQSSSAAACFLAALGPEMATAGPTSSTAEHGSQDLPCCSTGAAATHCTWVRIERRPSAKTP